MAPPSSAQRAALAARIEARADALAARTLARMYENPFWEARFGERGRRFAAEDQHHHLQHLGVALRLGGAETMAGYARWVQVVLTSRGMCSRHLAENFARLGEAVAAEGIAEAGPALAYLGAAKDALTYDGGPARAVQEATPRVVDDVVSGLDAQDPGWWVRWGEAGRARCRDDLSYHLSYLADALALGRPDVFSGYVGWVAGFLAGLGVPRSHLADTLAAMHRACRCLPREHRAPVRAVVASGQDALGAEAP
jgi:hypothetical protein